MQNSERGDAIAATAAMDLAQRSDLSERQVAELLDSADPEVRAAVAGNLYVNPATVYAARAFGRDRGLRRAFARRTDLSAETLDWLARPPGVDEAWDVRAAIANNPNTGGHTLERLAADSVAVRLAAGGNLHTPPRVLEILAGDRRDLVRLAVAANPSTPTSSVAALAGDASIWVSGVALGNPSIDPVFLDAELSGLGAAAWVLKRAANNPRCAPAVRERIYAALTAGESVGDPDFDPISLNGNPSPDLSVPARTWYRNFASQRSIDDALAPIRLHSLEKCSNLSSTEAVRFARDPDAEIRVAANRFNLPNAEVELQLEDEDPRVRNTALRAQATLPAREREAKGNARIARAKSSWVWPMRTVYLTLIILAKLLVRCDSKPYNPSPFPDARSAQSVLDQLEARNTSGADSLLTRHTEGGSYRAAPATPDEFKSFPAPAATVAMANGTIEVTGGTRANDFPVWVRVRSLAPGSVPPSATVVFAWSAEDVSEVVPVEERIDLSDAPDWLVQMKPWGGRADVATAIITVDGEVQEITLVGG